MLVMMSMRSGFTPKDAMRSGDANASCSRAREGNPKSTRLSTGSVFKPSQWLGSGPTGGWC